MGRKNQLVALVVSALLLGISPSALAGDLNPPVGPVGPTQRTPVNANMTPGDADSLFKITQPGSYYLTANVTGVSGKSGIEIGVSGVTLDLMGFQLVGVAGSLDGIVQTPAGNTVVVRGGLLTGWGGDGVDLSSSRSVLVSGIVVRNVGGIGIRVQYNAVIEDCTIDSDSTGTDGISVSCCSLISRCHVQALGDGIAVNSGCDIVDCVVNNCGDDGIVATSIGNHIQRCASNFNDGDGIQVASGCQVFGNTCHSNGGGTGAGVHATSSDNRIEANNVVGADAGIDVDAGGNLIIRNSASGNTTNYSIAAGNTTGTIVATEAAMNAATNSNVNIAF